VFNFLSIVQLKRRKKILKEYVKRLRNNNFTLISNNCNGGVLLHELGIKFNSQFINLYINASDYVKYLKRFDYYNNLTLEFLDDTGKEYPVGKLDDITIDFVHYASNEEANQKWEERKKRINKNNMFVMFTEQDDCTKEILRDFDLLPIENKIVFTYRYYPDIKSAVFVKKYAENEKGIYMFLDFENYFSIKRNYDCFDFVSWFNGEKDLISLMRE
jgi:uncharacterized protein (DUF1919 family)